MEQSKPCPVCGNESCQWNSIFDRKVTAEITCKSCGQFCITRRARDFVRPSEDGAGLDEQSNRKLQRYLYETRSDASRTLVAGGADQVDADGRVLSIWNAGNLYADDGSPLDKYQNTLRAIAASNRSFGYYFILDEDRWLIPTMDDDEAKAIVRALQDDGYLKVLELHGGNMHFALTPVGLQYAAELASGAANESETVFIAACFSPELRDACDTIYNTVEGLGYKPRIVNREPHNSLIDLVIYQMIRESRFVVADLTCNRQSVYYEVGFAHGLGLEVVLTCRKDHMADTVDDFRRVHFDLNHRNILTWDDCNELATKLRAHVYQSFGALSVGR